MALPAVRGHLRVEAISFTPPGADAAILRDVSFAAEPGEALAILGPSGSGKSSLAQLLVGAMQPGSGVVRLDEANIADWPRAELGPHIGYLPQEPELFAGSVRDNIARLGRGGDEAVVRAAEIAGVHAMILRLPEGYQTEVGVGGARLSAGQRQRIALARAVFGAPQLVVLDDPSANLDVAAERALARAVQALKTAGATVVVVSHRPAVLAEADKVLMEIVPEDDRLTIDARAPPTDIDSLHAGLPAEVRLTAFKAWATPTLRGEVTYVSADRLVDEATGEPYYDLRVEVDREELERLPDAELYPGMPVQTIIITGERPLLQYVVQPVLDSLARAFRAE